MRKTPRPDQSGSHKAAYDRNKKLILARDETCALCGLPVDKSLRFPHPLSATVDHIVPIARGGHPSSLENLQLAHLICNQVKGSKLVEEEHAGSLAAAKPIGNRVLPQSIDWLHYKAQ